MGGSDQLAAARDRVLHRVTHWSRARWAQPATGVPSRADLVFGLVQQLADLGAEVEGRPTRPVPRVDSDLVLPDQLRVMVADLLAAPASEDTLGRAADAVDAVARAL